MAPFDPLILPNDPLELLRQLSGGDYGMPLGSSEPTHVTDPASGQPISLDQNKLLNPDFGGRFMDALAGGLSGMQRDPRDRTFWGSFLPAAGHAFAASRQPQMAAREELRHALAQRAHDENVARIQAQLAWMKPQTADNAVETITDPETGKPKIVARKDAIGQTPWTAPAKPIDWMNSPVTAADQKTMPWITKDMIASGMPRDAAFKLKPGEPPAGVAQFDPVATHQAMMRGDIPTDPSGYTRGQWGMITSAAAKAGDKQFKNRQLDWFATRTYWGTRNRQQQLSILQNLERVGPSLDLVGNLSKQFYSMAPGFGIKKINSASVTAAANGLYGPQAKRVAGQLIQQINDVRFELQQVYGNGYSPTDQALRLASEGFGKEWDYDSLQGLIDNAKQNVDIRRSSVMHVGPSTPDNPTGATDVAAPAPTAAPATKRWVLKNGKLVEQP